MTRQAILLPPGIKRLITSQASRGTWWDGNLVRWRQGQLQPVGGWLALPGLQLTDAVRALLSWRDDDAVRWVAAGSLSQIVVYDETAHDITPDDFGPGDPADLIDGYGIGLYGWDDPNVPTQGYGTPRTPDNVFSPRAGPGDSITFDNYGSWLMAMGSADGRLLQWVPDIDVTTKLVPVANAPRGRTFITTNERSIVVIGADGDPRRVSWCDLENPTVWNADITNLAGSLQLKSTGSGLAARRIAQGIMIWCDDDVHLLQFVGSPYAYGLTPVGAGCGPISPNSMVSAFGRTAWIGQQAFWQFDGVPRVLQSDVADYVLKNINRQTAGRTVAAHNGAFPEFWWLWPDESSIEPNRYCFWNYAENIWGLGTLLRTGINEPGAYGLPLMGDASGLVYEHEQGWTDNGNARFGSIYCESGDIMLGEGDTGICVASVIPDADSLSNINFHFFGQWEPGDTLEDLGVYSYTRTDGLIDTLFEARSIRMRIEAAADAPWTLGRVRLDMKKGAGR